MYRDYKGHADNVKFLRRPRRRTVNIDQEEEERVVNQSGITTSRSVTQIRMSAKIKESRYHEQDEQVVIKENTTDEADIYTDETVIQASSNSNKEINEVTAEMVAKLKLTNKNDF